MLRYSIKPVAINSGKNFSWVLFDKPTDIIFENKNTDLLESSLLHRSDNSDLPQSGMCPLPTAYSMLHEPPLSPQSCLKGVYSYTGANLMQRSSTRCRELEGRIVKRKVSSTAAAFAFYILQTEKSCSTIG